MKYENWNKMDLFMVSEEDPLKKYNFFFKKLILVKVIIALLYLNHFLVYFQLFIQKY